MKSNLVPTPEEFEAWLNSQLQPFRHKPETIELLRQRARERREREKMLKEMLDGRPWILRDKGVMDGVLRAFDSGEWLTSVQVRERTGISSSNVRGTITRLVRWGCLDKRERKEYDKTLPFYWHPGGDCRYEYRQTPRAWEIREAKRLVRTCPRGAPAVADRARRLREKLREKNGG